MKSRVPLKERSGNQQTQENDTSGDYLCQSLQGAGHSLAARQIVKDDIYQIRARTSQWIASDQVDAILITGGTGFSGRDSTPEALAPLFDKAIDGFGELFRQLSYQDIGTSTIQSRALAGFANNTVIFAMPGSARTMLEGVGDINTYDNVYSFIFKRFKRICVRTVEKYEI